MRTPHTIRQTRNPFARSVTVLNTTFVYSFFASRCRRKTEGKKSNQCAENLLQNSHGLICLFLLPPPLLQLLLLLLLYLFLSQMICFFFCSSTGPHNKKVFIDDNRHRGNLQISPVFCGNRLESLVLFFFPFCILVAHQLKEHYFWIPGGKDQGRLWWDNGNKN